MDDLHHAEPVLRAVGLRTRQCLRLLGTAFLAPAEQGAPVVTGGPAASVGQPQDA